MPDEENLAKQKQELIDQIVSHIIHGESSPYDIEHQAHVRLKFENGGWDIPSLELINEGYRGLERKLAKAKKKVKKGKNAKRKK